MQKSTSCMENVTIDNMRQFLRSDCSVGVEKLIFMNLSILPSFSMWQHKYLPIGHLQ